MELNPDQKEVMRREMEIRDLIRDDNKAETFFQYELTQNPPLLRLITYNPRHGSFFLLENIFLTGLGELMELNPEQKQVQLLQRALEKLKQKLPPHHSLTYELVWTYEGKEHVSHFHGTSLMEAVQKFHYTNNPHDYVIQTATLKPSS